jgi:membrane protein
MAFIEDRRERVGDTARRFVAEYRESEVSFMAGSIAYAAFVSLLPFVVLLLITATFVGGQALIDAVIATTRRFLTPAAQGFLVDTITKPTGRVEVSIIGGVTLLWGVSKVFRSLDTAFARLYRTTGSAGIIDQLKDVVVVALGIGIASVAMIASSVVAAAVPDLPYLEAGKFITLVLALALAFFPIYYVFPDVDLSVREVIPGVLVAAIGWTALQGLFQVYVAASSIARLYGVLGGVLLFVTWLYFGALLLLAGATLNVVLANRDGPRPTRTGTES